MDKDPLLCNNYRPISLLNVAFKILSIVPALRLQRVMSLIISLDQTAFMLGRQSFHNTRRLLNILKMPSSNTPEMVVSLDAEKAFDRVEWRYLFEAMERFVSVRISFHGLSYCTQYKQTTYSHPLFLFSETQGRAVCCHRHYAVLITKAFFYKLDKTVSSGEINLLVFRSQSCNSPNVRVG